VRRAVLLVAAFPGATPAQIERELVGRMSPIYQRALEAGARVRTGVEIPNDPLVAVATATGREVTPVVAIIEVTAPPGTSDAALIRTLEGFGYRFGGIFDHAKSAVVVGSVKQITSGPMGPIMLALGTRKLAGISYADMHAHWANVHAPLALSMMPPGGAERISYQQLHAEEQASRRAAEAAGVGIGDYAGVLQVLCKTPEDFLSMAAEPSFAAKIAEDEKNFAEQSGMRGGFLRLAD
jgi:hypothetical protein